MILAPLDYAIIILYFIIIITIGFASARLSKTKEDYLVAGRRLSFPLFFGCMSALALGGGSTIGSTSLGYRYGLGGVWLNLSIGLGLIAAGFLITSKLSKLRVLSVNEVVEQSYGSLARLFSSLLTLIYTLTLSVVQVISIGTIINGITGISSTLSMILGGGIVVLYTFVGGMWSVTMTDLIQFIVKTLGILILAPCFCLLAAGGLTTLFDKVPESFTSLGSMGFNKSFAYLLLYVPGLIIGQDIWQRIFTAKNNHVAKRGTISAGIYSIIYAFATVVIGMSVAALLPSLNDPQDALVAGVTTFLPIGLRGLVLAAAMAATMSVSSGTILASSTILYTDLYKRFSPSFAPPFKEVTLTRLCALFIGVVVMICSLWIQDVLVGIDICYGYLSGCVFVPLVASFVLKRFSPYAGLFSLGTSAVVVSGCFLIFGTASSIPLVTGMSSGLIVYTIINKSKRFQ